VVLQKKVVKGRTRYAIVVTSIARGRIGMRLLRRGENRERIGRNDRPAGEPVARKKT